MERDDRLERVRQLGEEEVSRWTDTQFGGVAVVGHRAGRDYGATRVGGDNESDPRFAPIDHRGNSLRSAVEAMLADPAVIQQIADDTGNPEFVAAVKEERELTEAQAFLASHPDYYGTDFNYELIRRWLSAKDLIFTRENLDRAFKVLRSSGELEVAPGTPRPLTEHDRRAIALQAASGDVEGAVTRFLMKRLPEDVADMWMYHTNHQDALDDVARPEFAKIIEEAVYFCWEQGRPNYTPTRERRRFMREYVAGRIPNARLLDQAWAACQAAERDVLRSDLLSQLTPTQPQTPSEQDLDDLSDEQVRELYGRTRRHLARDASWKGAGILQ